MSGVPPLRTRDLTRYFGSFAAVEDLSLDVPEGSVFALLGRNGAGKTTAIKMFMGFLHPSRGTVEVLGRAASVREPAFKQRIGYMSETQMYPPWMTVRRLLRFHSQFYPGWDAGKAEGLIGEFRLNPSLRVKNLSKGQRRQLALALVLSQGSELIMLDEPFAGLDVEHRRHVLELLVDFIGREGRTALISSHILSDVERIVSHVGIIRDGRLLRSAEIEALQARTKRIHVYGAAEGKTPDGVPGAEILRVDGGSSFCVGNFSAAVRDAAARHFGTEPEVEDLSLEDIFLAYTASAGRLAPLRSAR